MIRTKQDVFDHFGVEDDKGLDRALYKYTACGAWGKVTTEDIVERKKATWTGKYTRCQGEWTLQGIFDADGKPVAPVPEEVAFYFWPDYDANERQKDLESILGSGMEAEHSAEIEWSVKTGQHDVFMVGSIVEGVDEEAETEYVYLPCTGKDLDDAVERVEQSAEFIWKNTHGCEECAKRNGWEWPGCAVDEECPVCGGDGTVI